MTLRFLTVILGVVLLDSKVNASEESYPPIEIPIGPFDLRPVAEIAESYNDNIFFNDQSRKGSMVTQIRAGLQLALERKLNRYALNYAFQSSQYHSSPHDNYLDQYVGGQGHVEFTSRNRLDFDARFVGGHYQRGTYFNQGTAQIQSTKYPDAFHEVSAQGRYRYGGETAKGNLELVLGVDDFTFINNRQRTSAWDRTQITVTPGFYYRIFPKTYSVIQMENVFLTYKNHDVPGITNPDFNKQRYLVGATWEQSAKTQGSIRLGYLDLEFDSSGTKGISAFTWDATVLWAPKSYSNVRLNLNRDVQPTLGFGVVRLIDSYSLRWTHDWSSRISTRLQTGYQQVNHRGVGRRDDVIGLQFDASYVLARWLGVGLSYTYRDQQSTFKNLDYGQNTIMFYVTGSPGSKGLIQTPWQDWY